MTTTIATATLPDRPRTAGSAPRRTSPAWSPWPTISRPATAIDEQLFVRSLADAAGSDAGRDSAYGRPDVTLLLNALRCGLSVSRLATLAPGMRPERVLAAYLGLEAARRRAAHAWRAIVRAAEPRRDVSAEDRAAATLAALAAHGDEAAKLLPTKVVRLVAIAKQRPADVAEAADRAGIEVSVQAAHVQRIEAAIERVAVELPAGERADDWAAELGALLYDPFGDAVANRPDFLPERVGLLSPTRVAALLGERPGPPLT